MSPGRLMDHPRSRGVYYRDAIPVPAEMRIIPARAGFTPGKNGGKYAT